MSKDLLENLDITVMKGTADGLRKIAHDAGMTIGEVVDRLTIQMCPTDPDIAFTFIMQEILIITSDLNKENKEKVLLDAAYMFLVSCSPGQLDSLVADVKQHRKETSLSDEEKRLLTDALRQVTHPSEKG